MAAPTLSAATITQESGKFSWTDVNFDHGVSIKELAEAVEGSDCFFDPVAKKITMNGHTSGTFGAFYEIEITVPFHFSGLKGNIVVNKEDSSGSGPDNYYYPTDLTTWNQSYHDIFVDSNQGGMFTGSEHQIIANSAGYSSGTVLNGGAQNNTTFTQTYTQTTGMKPTNIIRIRMYQDHARHWSIAASDFNIQALPDISFPIVQMSFSAAIANNTNVNVDDFSLKIHGESTPIGKVLTDSGNVLLLPGVDKRSPLVTNSPILSSALASGSGGTVSTLATGFSNPYGMTVVGTTLYVCDSSNNLIKKVTSDGTTTTFAGSGTAASTDGTGASAAFNIPYGLTDDGTNLYVSEFGGTRIRKIVIATAVVTTLAGSSTGHVDATGTNAKFSSPRGIICDNAGTNLYVADQGNHRIRKIVIATGVVTTFAGSGTNGDSDGTGTAAQFSYPRGITIDSTDANLYVAADTKIRKIVVATGVVTTLATITNAVRGITIDNSNEYLYIPRVTSQVIDRLKLSDNSVTTYAGAADTTGNTNGSLGDARFNNPATATFDSNNNLYVAEYGTDQVRKIAANPDTIELTFNSNIKNVATYNAGDFVVTDSTTTVTIAPSVSSNKLVLTPSGHTFSNLTNVRIVYTRHATANRNLLYTDDTAIESFDLLLDNNLSAANRTKSIEVTYTKHGTASRNIADASSNAVASFSNNNDNTAAPTLSSMTIGDEGNRMGGWRKLDYSGGVKITQLADVDDTSNCTFDKTTNTISMGGAANSGSFGHFYQIDITVPYKITGLRGQLSVQSDKSTNLADDRYYPEDLTTWVQSYHEINRDENHGSWIVGTDKQIIARVGGTNGSGVLSTPSKGDGKSDIPFKVPVLLKYVQTTSMTSTNVVRIRVYQDGARIWTLKELKLEVLPDPSLKLIELNFSDTVYFGSNTKKDIFSVKRGNESVEVIDAKSVGSKILLLTGGEFTHVDQANVEYYNDKFSSIAANGNNLDITLSNNVLITDDIDNDITLKTTSGTQINVDASISSGKLSLTKKGNVDLTSDHSPLRSNFAYSHSTSTTITNESYKVARSFDVSKKNAGYFSGDTEYNASDGTYAGSATTSGYAGQWFQIDVGVPTIVTSIEVYFHAKNERFFKDYRIFGSADNSTFTQILNVTNRPNQINLYRYIISGASSARYYRIAVNKNHGFGEIQHQGYFKFIGIPDSSVSFSNTNYTVEYNQSNIDKLVKTSDVNISIPSFKIVNGVDNTFQMRNISGNTIGSFTKDNGDSSTPLCTSVSIANESSNMGGWRKLDYSGGVKITELANVAANGTVCLFDDTTNTISMNGSSSGTFGAFYQIDITVPYKITGLRGQLFVQGDKTSSEPDDYYYPEDLTTWAQSYHEINRDEGTGSWVVGTDKQIIARVGGTNGSGVLSTPSRGDGKGDIPIKIPILLKYAQTTSMTSTNVVRIQVYQDHARHWTLKELQLEVLPDTNLKIVELNFSSNVTINSSLKKDIISLKRGGEKINIIDIKESTSKALLLTDGIFEHADEIDVQYYQDKVSNVSVDSNNLQLTFTNSITSKKALNYRDFTVTNFDGIVIPIKPTISSGKLVISKSILDSSRYIDLTSPDSIFKNDFFYSASSYYKADKPDYEPDASFILNSTTHHYISEKDDYSGTDNAYAGSLTTTNGYGGQWVQIDIGRQVTVRLIKFKILASVRNPKEIKVFGSNDDSSWTEIAQLNYPGKEMFADQEMLTPTAASYRYYRFVAGKLQGSNNNTHVYFNDRLQLLGLPESSTFTDTKYKIEYNKNSVTKDENLIRNSAPTIAVPSFKIIDGIDCTTTISNYKGTSVSSFNQNSGDSAAPSFHSAAIVNENSKFGWQKVTMGVPTITIVEKTDNETMVWDNTAKTATMSGSTSSAFGSVIQLDFTAPCFFVGLRGQFKMESLTTNYADDYYYPETLSTWNQAKTAISPNSNYGANLLGSDKQIIARVGGTDGNARLNASARSRGDGFQDIPQNIPIFLKYVQTTSMTETNIIRIKIYQDSRNNYRLSDFQLEVLPATTYKIAELTFTENMINKDFDGTDFDIQGLGEVGSISNALTDSGKVYLLPSVRIPVLSSLNLRYRANTFSSIAAVAGNLDITFSNYVTVSGSLNSDDFTVKDANGYTIPVTPTISSNKVRLTKAGNVKFSHDRSFNQIITASGVASAAASQEPSLTFDGDSSSTGWASTIDGYSSGTYTGANTTGSYNGEWIQIDIGTTVVLDNLKIYPNRNDVNFNPKSMRLFYSTNGSSWTQGADWTNLTAAYDWRPSGTWTPVTKTGLALSGRYFRLAVNETLGGGYVMIWEIELYGFIGSTSFTSTDGTVIYTKSSKASENIVNASDATQAIGSFTLFNGSEDLTGHLTDVAGNTQPAFNVLSADSTAPTVSSSSLSGANLTLVFSEDIYEKDTYNVADFDVQLSGDSMTVNSISISSGDVVLALASTPSSVNALRVVYTKHATTNRNIVDSAGNPVANFTHIPSNDSTPPTFAGISIGGVHTGTGVIESVVTKAESDYAPSYSSIALASGNIEVTFTANVANTGGNLVVKEGGSVVSTSGSISGGKLVIAKLGAGSNFSPDGIDLINEDGTAHARDRGDLANQIDENTGTDSWTTSSYTSASHGPFIIAVDVPSSKVGQVLTKVIINKGDTTGYGTTSFKVGYRRSSSNSSLNVSSISMTTSTGSTNTGTVTFSNDTDWHVEEASVATTITLNLGSSLTLATGDKILIRWISNLSNYRYFLVREITLTSAQESGSFTNLGNIEVDYTKGAGSGNLRDSNGFDVPNFEITNNVNTTGVVPEYSSIATASNNIEVTFNQTLVDPGSLNKDDFHVTYNGSVSTISDPTISGGKLVISSTTVNFTSTSNLIVDYMKHHSTTARRLQNADGDEVASFEITNGSLTNDQTKPTFSSVAVASGKLELTFSENIAAASTLNAADFTVTDSGTNRPLQTPTISSGKLLLERDEYSLGGTTPYDLSSSSSALSGQTYSSSSQYNSNYVPSKAFDGNDGGTFWLSANNRYSSGTYTGSVSTEGYAGEWIQVDIGQKIYMTSYEFWTRNRSNSPDPKNMRFFYSTNGTNWTQIKDWTGLTTANDWKPGGSYTYIGETGLGIVGRYFRLAVNKTQSQKYTQLGEMSIVGLTLSEVTTLSFANTNVTIKYTKHDDASRHLIRVDDPSDPVDSFTITNGSDTTPAATASKDGILIDLDQNIASSSGYAAGNFAVTESAVSKSVRAVKITPDNKVFLSMSTNISSISDTNITYTPSGTPSENLETTGGAKTLGFTITNGSDATTRTNDRIILNFSEDIVSKTTYSPDDFKILDSVTKTSTTTFSSIAVASGKLELSFNNSVAVTGALVHDDFTLEDTSGNAVGFTTPVISGGKVSIEKDDSIDIASTNSTISGQTYSESSKYDTSGANLAFDNEFSQVSGGHAYHWHSSATGTHYNTGSTHNYIGSGNHSTTVSGSAIAGEWIQVDIGQSITLAKFIVEPNRSYNVRNPRKFTLAGSTNGSTWTLIRTVSGLEATTWLNGSTWSNIGPYYNTYTGRYFRFIVEETIDEIYTALGELRLFGYTSASSFTNTDYVITYTKHATASRNIVKASDTSDAIDSFRIDSGSETGLLKNVALISVVAGDVQLKTPIKADNQTPIDIASSASTLTGTRTYTSSSFLNSTYPAADAFDNNNIGNSLSWITANGAYSNGTHNGSGSTDGYDGEWVQVDVGTTVVLTSYEIYPRGASATYHAEKMRFFSSTDGTNWTQIQDWTGLTVADNWQVGGSYTSVGPYTTNTYGRYFRLAINKLIGGNYGQVGELRLLGYSATSDSLSSDAGLFEITYTNPGINGRNLVDLAGNVVQTFTGRDRPAFSSATLTTTRIAQVTFSVNLKDMSPLKSDFNVKLNGTSTSIESVSISGGKLIINLVRTMTPHSESDPQVLTLDYTKNSSATYNLRDASDSAVESFTNKSINNPTSDTEPPVFVGAEIFDDEPTKVVLNFDFAVTISSPNVSVFQVKVNGSAVTISSVAIVSGDIVLTLASGVSHTDTVTVSYTKDDSDANKNIKDVSSNILETPLKSEHGTIKVTVVNEGSGNKYALEGVTTKNIILVKGFTYEFDTSDTSVSGHPFKLSTTKNGTHASGSEYTSGVTHSGTPGSSGAKTTFVVPNDAPATLYYYCGNHSGMGGDATITILADSFAPVVNSVVASAIKSFKNDVQSGGIRDGIVAKRWSRFRTNKAKLTIAQRKYYGKDYFRSNPSAKIFKIIDEQNGQSIAFLKPSTTGDPGTAQELNLDENEAEIAFDNTSAEQSSLLSFTFDPQRNGSTTNTVQVKILFVKRITGTTAKFTYTLNGYTGNGIYSGKVVLVPAFTGGGTTGLITVTNMEVDTDQTINCDVTIEYTSSPGTTVDYTKSFTFFARNPAGGFSNDNTSTAGDPYIKTVNGQFYKLRDIPHKSVILYDNNNSERRIQLHAYLEPNVNYKKQVNGYDDTIVSQMGERPINPAFFSKLWIRNRDQEYFIDLETWIETKTGKNIIDLFNVDFAIETCKFHVYLSEKCVTVKLPIEGDFFIIIKRFINPEIRTGIELSMPTWMSSPLAYGALLYPGETNDLFIDKLDDKLLKSKARGLKNMTTVRENFANPETGSVKVVDWKY